MCYVLQKKKKKLKLKLAPYPEVYAMYRIHNCRRYYLMNMDGLTNEYSK